MFRKSKELFLRNFRTIVWACAIGFPIIFLVAGLWIKSLSEEIETRFYETFDSVPTRVYSSLYWVRAGVGASGEEILFRLKERDYRQVDSPEAVQSPATFFLALNEQRQIKSLVIYTAEFAYPSFALEVLFGNPQASIRPTKYKVSWEAGRVQNILDASGAEISGFALEPTLVAQLNEGNVQARRTVPIGQIPHTLMKGIVLTEDQRFFEHFGIDLRGILRSIYVNIRSGAYVQGASTITQQLARNIYLTRQKTIWRKLKEVVVSLVLEWKFSKDQILEKYLNEVYFGQSGNIAIHGVNEAAKFYFGKSLEDLSVAEQAMLSGIVRGPFFYSPFRHLERAKGRQEIVLSKMFEAGVITEKQFERAKTEKMKFVKVSLIQNRAPYFTDMIQAQILKDMPDQEVLGTGYTIFSTLDTYYQQLAEKAVSSGVASIEERLKQYLDKKTKKKKVEEEVEQPEIRLVQGVFLAVDPNTGYLLSMVGGRSYEESNYNRAILMKRQIGSLIKPYVYLSALIHGKNPDGSPINSISKYEDQSFTYEYDYKTWTPRNYDEEFQGTVTLRFALANSINTVAAKVAIDTGLDHLVEIAGLSGIEAPMQPLPSLSLGAIEVPPMEVATSYNTLANFGVKKEITSTLVVVAEDGQGVARFHPREDRVLPPEETSNLVQLMTSVFDIGTAKAARAMGFTWPAAGKTGTTNEFRDAWFAGFTRKIVAVSWVGFDRDDEIVRKHRKALKLTGAVAALPPWVEFMKGAHKDQDGLSLPYPDGMLRTLDVDLITGKRANYRCMGDSVIQETFTYRNVPLGECN
jgi:penicillin-binding protein 1B